MDKRTCPECGAIGVKSRLQVKRFAYGIGRDAVVLEATVPVRKCRVCPCEYTDGYAEKAQTLTVLKHRMKVNTLGR